MNKITKTVGVPGLAFAAAMALLSAAGCEQSAEPSGGQCFSGDDGRTRCWEFIGESWVRVITECEIDSLEAVASSKVARDIDGWGWAECFGVQGTDYEFCVVDGIVLTMIDGEWSPTITDDPGTPAADPC